MKIPDFLILIYLRLIAKTPAFFKYVRLLGAAAAIVVKMPDLLKTFAIVVPDPMAGYVKNAIAIAGATMVIVAQLTAVTPPEVQK